MRVISIKKLRLFWTEHANAVNPLWAWYREADSACWKTTQDIKNAHRSADFLADNRVIFNIGGNKYRLIVKVEYELQRVYILWVGTHAEYDKIDAKKVTP